MNHDDPKLTAYALNELPPEERAEIEATLREHPATAAEAAETQQIAGIMRQLFRAELTETLTPRRREVILQAAQAAQAPKPVALPSNVIVPHPAWWQRASTWQWAAACLVFGFGVYAISSALMSKSPTPGGNLAGNKPGFEVPINGLAEKATANDPQHPEVGVPKESLANGNGLSHPNVAVSGVQKPVVNVTKPGVDLPPALIPHPTIVANPGAPRQPEAVGQGPDPSAGLLNRAAASVGKRPKINDVAGAASPSGNPDDRTILHGDTDAVSMTLSAEEASRYYATNEFLNRRWNEATSIHEKDTYKDLSQYFRRDGGSQSQDAYRFVMIRCPFIKVEVTFDRAGAAATWPIDPEAKIRTISKPYFEPERK